MTMAKKGQLTAKMVVDIGSVSLGKADTAKLSLAFKFEDAGLDANQVLALLAGGNLKCRLDRGNPKQGTLPLGDVPAPVTTLTVDGTCHRVGMSRTTCNFGISFPKAQTSPNALGDFAGQTAKLTVVRTGDIEDIVDEDHGEPIEEDDSKE
jgi:hypothetical protein